jgi:hypothetical protein
MTVRRPTSAAEVEKYYQFEARAIARVYGFWLLGLIVGAVQLRPTSVSLAGVSFTLENPETVQGLIFLASICSYAPLYWAGVPFQGLPAPSVLRKRRAIYLLLGRKRTLRGKSKEQRQWLKTAAKGSLCYYNFSWLIYNYLPLAYILIFRHGAVWAALKSII